MILKMSIEVLFSYEKERIRRPEDAIVCCLHSYMTANGYKCIGSGEKVDYAVTLLLFNGQPNFLLVKTRHS